MTLREFLRVVARWWPLIVGATLAAAAVMWIITPADLAQRPQAVAYTASTTVLVNSTAKPVEGDPGQLPNIERLALYLESGAVPEAAAKAIKYSGTAAQLAESVDVEVDSAAGAITLSSRGRDGQKVADMVNAFAEATVKFFKKPRTGVGPVSIEQMAPATPLAEAVGGGFVIPPSRIVRGVLAGLLGLIVGIGLALMFGRLDSRLRSRDQVQETMDLPIIAEVPMLSRALRQGDPRIGAVEEPLSVYAEGYRTARTAIVHVLRQRDANRGGDEPPTNRAQVILVASAQPSEGKTTSAANLAAMFAETGNRVLVLDADLRSPDAHVLFDVPQGAGISDYVSDPASHSLEALARPTSVPGVRIVTAGTTLEHPAALVSRMGQLLSESRTMADIVIIDTAPLLAASDVFDLLPHVDVVTLVVRSGRLSDAAGARVSELLARFPVPVAGVILVGVKASGRKGYGYGYGYGKGAKKGGKAKAGTSKSRKASGKPPATRTPQPSRRPDSDEPRADPVFATRAEARAVRESRAAEVTATDDDPDVTADETNAATSPS